MPADFRPVANTSIASKMFERVLAKHILLLARDTIRTNNQYGFLPGWCTHDAIIQALDDWGTTLDKKGKMLAIFFDFAKAFDLVDHNVLLSKLSKILLSWLCSWIVAYLTNRRQRVIFNCCLFSSNDYTSSAGQNTSSSPPTKLMASSTSTTAR
ncbi:hypothetical protein KDA14_06280 [Candidatus Saccharibacteria bacterium]|nr:hypothetical protein [Candidatus Saccharibacteria bacterium]